MILPERKKIKVGFLRLDLFIFYISLIDGIS